MGLYPLLKLIIDELDDDIVLEGEVLGHLGVDPRLDGVQVHLGHVDL